MNRNELIQFTETLILIQKALDFTGEGITIADCNQPDMPLIYVNKGFEELTGYSAEEVIGTNCRFLQGPDKDQEGIKILREAITHNQSTEVVLKNYRKDGTLFYNQLKISPIIDSNGKVTHFVGIQSNVTERIINEQVAQNLNEELSKSNTELIEANERIQEIQSIAAHDIKNPLNSIMSSIEILEILIERDKLTKNDLLKRLKIIETSSSRMLNLITDYLESNQLNTGKINIEMEEIDIPLKIETIVNHFKDQAKRKKIKFKFDIENNIEQAYADRNSLLAILDNLISNSVKYSPHNSHIYINAKSLEEFIQIEIIDEGSGIPDKDVPKLFKQFEKFENKPTGKESSTGLGLYIVKKHCDLIGAKIEYENREGFGATFILKIQKAKVPELLS